jgi:signal transduction histidine kinase
MSLRVRLTLWFTALLAVALVLFGVLVFTLVSQQLSDEIDASIQSKAHDLAQSVRYTNSQIFVPNRVQVPGSEFRSPTTYSVIRDAEGRVVMRSDTLQGSDLPASPDTLENARGDLPVLETVSLSGQGIRLYTAPLLINGQFIGYVQVGRNLADIDAALTHLRDLLLASAGLVLAAAAIGGWWLAHLALRPMDRIAQEARAIGQAQRIDRRLPVPPVRDEVGRLALTFNEMLDRLAAAFEAQQRFVADASHELRTPLTTIQGNVQLLRRNPDLPPAERGEALADVADEAARMARLVSGLLALARADAGRHLERAALELRPVLETSVHQAQLLARPANVEVRLDASRLAPGARVMGDGDRLSELIMVLLDNAVKYNRPGGSVRLVAESNGHRHLLAVVDTGLGIAPDDLPHVFERFYRSANSRAEDGTGLGLAIAQWIAHEHDATIRVESVPNVGSKFVVSFPAASALPTVAHAGVS